MDLINEWTLTPLRFLDDLTQPMPSCAQRGDDRKNGIELTVGAEIAEQAQALPRTSRHPRSWYEGFEVRGF